MTDELVEAVARLIAPSSWRVMDSYLEQTKRKYRGQNVGWPADQFQHKESLAIARAIIPLVREAERADKWQDISTAPKDGTEFLSYGGAQCVGKVQPTRWLSPGPYTTENGKNTEGQRRYQWPDGFYWAGYDGFVGPVEPTRWTPMPVICGEHTQESQP